MKCRPRTAEALATDYRPLNVRQLAAIAQDETETDEIRAMAQDELRRGEPEHELEDLA